MQIASKVNWVRLVIYSLATLLTLTAAINFLSPVNPEEAILFRESDTTFQLGINYNDVQQQIATIEEKHDLQREGKSMIDISTGAKTVGKDIIRTEKNANGESVEVTYKWYDVTQKYSLSEEALYEVLKNTGMSERLRKWTGPENGYKLEKLLIELEEQYSINPILVLAIGRAETQLFQDGTAAVLYNNGWGYGILDNGIASAAMGFSTDYVSEMQKFIPVGKQGFCNGKREELNDYVTSRGVSLDRKIGDTTVSGYLDKLYEWSIMEKSFRNYYAEMKKHYLSTDGDHFNGKLKNTHYDDGETFPAPVNENSVDQVGYTILGISKDYNRSAWRYTVGKIYMQLLQLIPKPR